MKIKHYLLSLIMLFVSVIFTVSVQAAESLPHFLSDQQSAKPTASDTEVLVWANEAIVSVYSYSFANYRTQLQSASKYFTSEAWKIFIKALTASKILNQVKENKYVVSAVATKPPIILDKKPVDLYYTWKVQMPLLVNYQSDKHNTEQRLVVTVLIANTGSNIGVRGLSIVQFDSEPEKDSDVVPW